MTVQVILNSIRPPPKTIVYLFSAGKDSAAALLLTRDQVREYAAAAGARVLVAYIYVTGNTHPLNAYCAAKVMFWHEKHYGFKPVFLANDRLFQEYMAKYGLQKGPRRWCHMEFKAKLLNKLHRELEKPVVYVDGMTPNDSVQRKKMIRAELEYVESKKRGGFWAWHPLYNYSGDRLELLRNHTEFNCIIRLYEKFGDSLNCIICPYKRLSKLRKYHEHEDLTIVYEFIEEVMRSKYWRKRFKSIVERNP